MAKMKVADYIVHFLDQKESRYVFGYIGGAVVNLVHAMNGSKSVKFIQFYHEQNAAFAAEGYSRYSGKMGVAIATSGPGATNLITGIADAFFDSIPVLYITGQVNTFEYKKDKPVRQQGFQETDIVSIVKPVTKYAVMLSDPEMIRYELEKAFYIATVSRPGPILLDIPMDVQRAEIDPEELAGFVPPEKQPQAEADREMLRKIIETIKGSKRPLVLAGGGCSHPESRKLLIRFCEKNHIPVVVSLMGKGAFPENHALYTGFIGSYGNRAANIILANADLLLALGTRLDTRQTGTKLDSFVRAGRIVHVDIDENEIKHNRLKREFALKSDVKEFLSHLLNEPALGKKNNDWLEYIEKVKIDYSQKKEVEKNIENKMPYEVMELLSFVAKDNQVFCADIGQNQMFAAQMLTIRKNQFFYTSGGMAPMGYSICAAIGASFASGNKVPIFAITGDGGFHISLQALLILSQYQLPVKVIVLNNHSLGMITQFQDLYFESKYAGTTKESGYLVPDIKQLAKAYYLDYFFVDKENMKDQGLIKKTLLAPGPAIVEFELGEKTVVSPKLQVNSPIEDLNPKLDRAEMKEAMLIDLFQEGPTEESGKK